MEVIAVENVDDVAAAFIEILGPLQTRKLQKLVYYSQAWNAAHGNGSLFDNDVEAWVEGPVIRHLWDQHSYQGSVDAWPTGDPQRLTLRTRNLIAAIVKRYGAFTGDQLSALTHLETPWVEARQGATPKQRSSQSISVEQLADYYGNQILSPAAAAAHARANAEIEGLKFPDELEALLVKIASGSIEADDAVADYLAQSAHLR